MQYGAIGYFVPHSVYPPGYHCDRTQPLPYVGIASQKNHMAIYLFCVYTSEEEQRWFREAWAKTGKKLDMGKSCVRFKKMDDVALDVIGKAIKRTPAKKFIAHYESTLGQTSRSARKKTSSKTAKATTRKTATKKETGKTAVRKVAKKTAGRTKKKVAKQTTKKATIRRRPR